MAAVTHRIATASSSNASSYASGAFTPAVGDLLVGMVVASGTTANTPTLTANSGAITFKMVAAAPLAASVDRAYLFVADQLVPSAVSMTATFTCTQDAATGAVVFVASVSGMARTGLAAIRQLELAMNVAAGTPALSFPASCLTGNPTIGLIGNATNPAGLTAPTGWTENAAGDTGYTIPTTGAEYVYRDSGFTGTTVTWGSASASAYAGIIVELDTSAVPATPAWSIIGTPTVNESATARTSTPLTPPSGTAADDYLFAYVGASIITGVGCTAPDGTWTLVDKEETNTAAIGYLFYKKLTGAASGTYTFTHNSTVTKGIMWAVRGLDLTNPLDRTVQAADFVLDQTIPYTVPGITTATDGAMLLTVCSTEWSSSRNLIASPAGYSEIVLSQATANTPRVGIHYRQQETAGSVPATEYHISTDATRAVLGQFAFKPAAAAVYANMVGAGSVTVSGTAVAQVVVRLIAANAVSVTGTAVAQVVVRLIAANALSVTGTAVMSPKRALAGVGTLSVTGSAALQSVVPLSGAGSVGVSGTGLLSVVSLYVDMAAVGTITLGGSASMQTVVPLVGSGTVSVQGTGTAGVVVPLSASGTIGVTGTATATAVVLLAASGSVPVVGVGNLSIAGLPYADMVGVGTITLAGTGAAQVVVPLVGAGTVAVVGTGAMLPKRALVGAGSVDVAGTGAVQVIVPMQAQGQVEVTGSAAAFVVVPMSGVGVVDVIGLGALLAVPPPGDEPAPPLRTYHAPGFVRSTRQSSTRAMRVGGHNRALDVPDTNNTSG